MWGFEDMGPPAFWNFSLWHGICFLTEPVSRLRQSAGEKILGFKLNGWELQVMKNLVKRFAGLVRNEEGASLVEYGLLVGLIAVVCIGAVTLVGGSVEGLFNQVATAL